MTKAIQFVAGSVLFALTALLPATACAAFYGEDRELLRLTNEVSYREDRGSATPFEKVSATNEGWVSQSAGPFRGTGEPVRLWARFDLPATPVARRFFIVTGPWEKVEYFVVRDGALVDRQSAGTLVPWSQRTTHVSMVSSLLQAGFVSVEANAGARTTVFARVASDNRFITMRGLRFSLWDEEQVREEERRDRLVQGAFLGIMLVLMAYNLAMYFAEARDSSYLFYVLSIFCVAISWLAASGLGFDLLWPEHPAWDHYSVWLASPLGTYAFAQFVRRYLDTGKYLPRVDAQLNWLALACLIVPPIMLLLATQLPGLREEFKSYGYVWFPVGGAILIFGVCVIALIERVPSARFFSIAIACAVVGALVASVAAMGLGAWPLLIHAHQLGFALMGILLSIGLGFRMRELRAELASRQIEQARISGERHQLEIAGKHKSEFLANMSHELRTPLNAIIGFSEVLIEKMFGELNEKQSDYLKDIHGSGQHLLSLINDILDLSKIEAGRMELELSEFHLPTAISNAMTLVRERAQRHEIQLATEIDARLAEVQADERKLKQILLNLLSNAVKFTPDGGRVEVRAKLDTTKVEIAVRDTGIGIAPEDQAAVFEEFKQVGGDALRKAEGTGLGLTLTRKLVELHGGEIRLESAPGKGSTFSFTLPLR